MDIWYSGKELRTDLIKVRRPPIERALSFHLESLEESLPMISSQELRLDIISPTLTPRKLMGALKIEQTIDSAAERTFSLGMPMPMSLRF